MGFESKNKGKRKFYNKNKSNGSNGTSRESAGNGDQVLKFHAKGSAASTTHAPYAKVLKYLTYSVEKGDVVEKGKGRVV